jgi:hypothetical protein
MLDGSYLADALTAHNRWFFASSWSASSAAACEWAARSLLQLSDVDPSGADR